MVARLLLLFCCYYFVLATAPISARNRKKVCAGTLNLVPADAICPPRNDTTSESTRIAIEKALMRSRQPMQPRVFDGQDAEVGEFRSHVQLIGYNTVTKEGNVCGGVVISVSAFATAAHCVYDYLHNNGRRDIRLIITNGSNRFSEGTELELRKIILHPEFEMEHFPNGDFFYDNDIAIVVVAASSLPESAVAQLPTKPKQIGARCVFAGFGSANHRDRFQLKHSKILQRTNISIISKHADLIDNSFYGSPGPAKGDSGCALLCPEAGGKKLVVAGIQTGIGENPIFLDVYLFRRWLHEMLEEIKALKDLHSHDGLA